MEKMKYKISSRATILLGRESVSKVDGAIIELVKNTYDADASLCYVCFDIEHNNIYIIDNGIGMTKETIQNYWMMIGTDNKKENYKSNKNRIKSGEKGIGRFALDRLGSKCEMYTKSDKSDKLILWKTDWSNFEQVGKTLDEIEAEFGYLEESFEETIPEFIRSNIKKAEAQLSKSTEKKVSIPLKSGTVLKISDLRDEWTEKEIGNIVNSMGFLLPPTESSEYIICIQKNILDDVLLVENEVTEEFDYKLSTHFDGNIFDITLYRNEFDLNKIPDELFEYERFKKYPYRKQDFEKGKFNFKYTISELIGTNDQKYIDKIKKIGSFDFKYVFE